MKILVQRMTRFRRSLSFAGLVTAAMFFAMSVAPSLLPRPYVAQGLLSGTAIAIGYGLGNLAHWLWFWLELPALAGRARILVMRVLTLCSGLLFCYFAWRMTAWQNSIRELMEMPPMETTYLFRMVLIAILYATVLLVLARLIRRLNGFVYRKLTSVLPTKVAFAGSIALVGLLLLLLVNDVLAKSLLIAADAAFSHVDRLVDEGITRPSDSSVTRSNESLVAWDGIGRHGKTFLVGGPTREEISVFRSRQAKSPLRVYVGLRAAESHKQRADLALKELKRIGAFQRKLLVVATPTGTGWLDPNAVDTLEYLHDGDTAIVSMQYSYLPSWINLLIDPDRAKVAARTLFEKVYAHWKTLPKHSRPQLYLHGLSLGSYGSEASANLLTIIEDPIQGALWSGPPFPSTGAAAATDARNLDSPAWLPTFGDGSILRFTNQHNALDQPNRRWGPIRCVYIQYASDPMIFFSPSLFWKQPEWLEGERGPDVSPYLDWYPNVTGLQIAFDLPMATSVPIGYGHNYAPANYIEGWVAVTQPDNWTDDNTKRLQEKFAKSR